MGDTIKAGAMGLPENPSAKPPEFAGSLAEAIETALNALLVSEGRPEFRTDDNSAETRDRRILFVAIAQGIVNHLTANEAAFWILDSDGDRMDRSIDIQTE